MKSLLGMNALVTGAAGAIGQQTSLALASVGANLVLTDLPARRDEIEALAEKLERKGVRACWVAEDLSSPVAIWRLLERGQELVGPIDILVNNAAVSTCSSYTRMSAEELTGEVQVNLIAPMLLIRAVLPGMLDRGRGHVVNIASLGGKVALPYGAAYGASKHAVVGLTSSLRMEYSKQPVGFSAVCPGAVTDAGMFQRMTAGLEIKIPRLVGSTTTAAVAQAVIRAIREDSPEEIVNTVPARPLIAFKELFPRLFERVMLRTIGLEAMQKVARSFGRL